MATFTNNYETATANTPILSSAWNANIDATKERFEKHDHSGIGEESGLQIGPNGLNDDVRNEFAGKAQFDTHNHSGGDNGPQIGTAGLDSEVNDLLDKIAALETDVTNLQNDISALQVQPTITGIEDTGGNPITGGNMGDTIKILGTNFYSPLTVRFKSIVVPEANVEIAADHSSITVRIPLNVDSGGQYISVSVGASAISNRFDVP